MDFLRTYHKTPKTLLAKEEIIPYDLEHAFIYYLTEMDQTKYIEIAKQIHYGEIKLYFTLHAKKLWSKLDLPKVDERYEELKWYFFDYVRDAMLFRILHVLFRTIKRSKNLDDTHKLNLEIHDMFSYFFHIAFESYEFQYTLTTINPESNQKIIIKELQQYRNKEKIADKFIGKKYRPDEVPVYEKF